jgi:hypothetical protein
MFLGILLLLAVLWATAIVQPGGTDFLRVSVTSLNGHLLTVLDALIGIVLLGVMAALRGFAIVAGIILFMLWGLSVLGYVRIEGIPVAALAVLVVILGGVVQTISHWAKR